MPEFVRRHPWLLPVALAVLMATVGWSSYRAIEGSMKDDIATQLETVRDATIAALELWSEEARAVAAVHGARSEIRDAARELVQVARRSEDPREALRTSPIQTSLRALLDPMVERHDFAAWAIVGPDGTFLAARSDRNLGGRIPGVQSYLDEMYAGRTLVSAPTLVRLLDQQSASLMIVGGPVRDENGEPIAIFGFSLDPGKVYARLLVVGRPGESGETLAFDEDGLLVSPSRFDDELREVGLLPDDPEVSSYLNIHMRDPGGDLLEGFRPTTPRKAWPLTLAAASAVGGGQGVDVDGYPDYRGVRVLGAWAWVPALEIGISTEIDAAEAYAGLYVLRRQFATIVGALAIAALGMVVYSLVIMRLSRQVDLARRIGRYRVIEKIGEGGMGQVFLARHAMLRRPTAVKVLASAQASEEAATRFEREVQAASSLTHPNTISIYDYGRTPDGSFYYAMEYLEGVTLGRLVEDDGAQPEARVRSIMQQAAASVSEAHGEGFVHRDLKPNNIMLCRYGGAWDFVKVLDFGLVRSNAQPSDLDITQVGSLTGTPLYLSPEGLASPEKVDARSDVYQLGSVAYYLLTGRHVFFGDNMVEVLAQHLHKPPVPPSQVLGHPVSPELERIVLACLAKAQDDRPRDAAVLAEAFAGCAVSGEWTQAIAGRWWSEWRERHPLDSDGARDATGSLPSGWEIDPRQRSGVQTRI
jgi:hypothetical protein